jgi:polyribonucleotide nucleotidyltransferase
MAIERKKYSLEVGDKTLTLEISELARQANAAVLAKYGDTAVLVTAVMGGSDAPLDYLPLKVDYEERFYAAGKIIGSRFIRREGRPSEEAILAGRLVDRAIRPLFDQRLRREIQVVTTVLAYDEENEPEFLGLIATSLALGISDIPWNGPVGGVRLAKIGKDFVVNPNTSDLKQPEWKFDSFVAGPEGKINMVELGGDEAEETDIVRAFEIAQKEIDRLVLFQKEIIAEIGRPKAEVKIFEPNAELKAAVEDFLAPRLEAALYEPRKLDQQAKMAELKKQLEAHLAEKFENPDLKTAGLLWEEAIDRLVHENILKNERRPDGRGLAEIRKLDGEVALFPRTHGSAIFIRGDTQALAVATLAAPGAEQLIETMETTGKRRFMLHYNFPPYSVGEIGSFRGPGRREIGHGSLAEKALRPLIPPMSEFPYTIRVVSEILSSNGSSSMATVCAASMALMDAGVPIRKPAAGIAMGLMLDDEDNFKVLTDIQGPEDHYGDMDFKVAGTDAGVNSIQLDVKIKGLTLPMIRETLERAKAARLRILDFMKSVIPAPRPQISKYAPYVIQLKIRPEKIGLVIGPGGRMINSLIRDLGLATIDIEEDGSVFIAAADKAKAEEAASQIRALTREFEVGETVEGRVVKILDFGAIVDLGGGQDGMIHISELKNGFVKNVSDVVRVGDFVTAKVIRVEDNGRIALSLKQVADDKS